MARFSLQISAIFLVILAYGSIVGDCVIDIVKCDEAECARICSEAYGANLIKSFCQDLPFKDWRVCICDHVGGSIALTDQLVRT